MSVRHTFAILAILACFPSVASTPYENKQCGYYFDIPKGWQVLEDPHSTGNKCGIRLRPDDFETRLATYPVDQYSIYLDIKPDNLDAMSFLADSGVGFKLGSFTTPGRFGNPYQATLLTNDKWSLVRGHAIIGCQHYQGSYVSDDCREVSIVALANGQENHFGFSITGPYHVRQIIDQVVHSFEFTNIERDNTSTEWGDRKYSD